MRKTIFTAGESVLLVGEGNFSFSVALLSFGSKLNLIATCYEHVLTDMQIANVKVLESHGACVLTGVDATKVHQHPVLMHKKFDKIVFNFPHTGGKMKIQQNRTLLRLFFESVWNVMSKPSGQLIVSLCNGQGADYAGKRTWADSWQIVDMAGHANLLLVECLPFEWANFPSYTNVGYRSLEKGFHSENAMVHVFSPVENSLSFVAQGIADNYSPDSQADPLLSPYLGRLLGLDILGNSRSPSFFVLNTLQDYVNSRFTCSRHQEKKIISRSQMDGEVACAVKMWKHSGCDFLLYSFYILSDCLTDLRTPPLTPQTLFVGNGNIHLFMQAVSELLVICGSNHKFFQKKSQCCAEGNEGIYLQRRNSEDQVLIARVIDFMQGNMEEPVLLSIFMDSLTSEIFSLKCWRQLWARNIFVTDLAGKLVITGLCPYPVSYTFDLSFVIDNNFTEENFFMVLRAVAGEIILDAIKISEYSSGLSDTNLSVCYRLSYLSFDHALCRKWVINFHQNVLSQALEKIMHVQVK